MIEPRPTKLNPNPSPYPRQVLRDVFFDVPVIVRLNIWRANANTYDVPNVDTKPIFDGFTQVRLWHGDDFKWLREVRHRFAGIDPTLARTAEEREKRSEELARRRERGKKPNRVQVRARFTFEFYPLTMP